MRSGEHGPVDGQIATSEKEDSGNKFFFCNFNISPYVPMLNFSCCGGHLVKTLCCHIGFSNNKKKKNVNFFKVQIRNIPTITKEQFHHSTHMWF